jgi:hypothetical protein
MSERIEVGDLVMVVRPGCTTKNLGRIFRVEKFIPAPHNCRTCGRIHGSGLFAKGSSLVDGTGIMTSRLRRIPPLTEPETTTETDKVTE